jgi:hypothetical protein
MAKVKAKLTIQRDADGEPIGFSGCIYGDGPMPKGFIPQEFMARLTGGVTDAEQIEGQAEYEYEIEDTELLEFANTAANQVIALSDAARGNAPDDDDWLEEEDEDDDIPEDADGGEW